MSLRKVFIILFMPLLLLAFFLPTLVWSSTPIGVRQVTSQATPAPQPLNWTAPARPQVIVAVSASVANDIATYTIYPINQAKQAVWDVTITVPVPQGATFLAAGAPAPFAASFDGRLVTFAAVVLADDDVVTPLRFQVSVAGLATGLATTRATATWHQVQTNLGQSMLITAESTSGEIAIQPHTTQQVVADTVGDVPFAAYDVTGVALQQEQSVLKITLATAEDLGAVGQPVELALYIDNDCQADTGRSRSSLGLDYRVRYQHLKNQANLSVWDTSMPAAPTAPTQTAVITAANVVTTANAVTNSAAVLLGNWRTVSALSVDNQPGDASVTVWIPHALLANGWQFCWLVESQDRSNAYEPAPPKELVPDSSAQQVQMQYNAWNTGSRIVAGGSITTTVAISSARMAGVVGKVAVPLVNAQGGYDTHLFSLPDQTVTLLADAGQPHFSPDGRHLLVSRTSSSTTGLFLYNVDETVDEASAIQVRDVLSTSRPVYDTSGDWLLYENAAITNVGSTSEQTAAQLMPLFWRCKAGTNPSSACEPLPPAGVAAPTSQRDALQGVNPVWVSDTIVYQGCTAWFAPDACGLYTMPALTVADQPFTLRRLTTNPEDVPTAAHGDLVAFMARHGQDWEVYVMRLDGTWVRNLAPDAAAHAGLPTFSPDGQSIAFVSNQGDVWAVW
ncbi:MAG: hypothetical protein M3Q45_10975, partial [Chloroflexota bacterium]|nr:hypothetical protein [Chloroflexota bacterium]